MDTVRARSLLLKHVKDTAARVYKVGFNRMD